MISLHRFSKSVPVSQNSSTLLLTGTARKQITCLLEQNKLQNKQNEAQLPAVKNAKFFLCVCVWV